MELQRYSKFRSTIERKKWSLAASCLLASTHGAHQLTTTHETSHMRFCFFLAGFLFSVWQTDFIWSLQDGDARVEYVNTAYYSPGPAAAAAAAIYERQEQEVKQAGDPKTDIIWKDRQGIWIFIYLSFWRRRRRQLHCIALHRLIDSTHAHGQSRPLSFPILSFWVFGWSTSITDGRAQNKSSCQLHCIPYIQSMISQQPHRSQHACWCTYVCAAWTAVTP